MINKKIQLNNIYNLQGGTLASYCMDNPFDRPTPWCRPAVIVVPGGAYAMVSKRESEPVAFDFLARGFNVFVLQYSCAPTCRYPQQLLQLACSVDFVKNNADEFHVNKDAVFAVGFSAGGHLVGNLSVNNGAVERYYHGKLNYSLTASALCYPVISASFGYTDTHCNLLGTLDEPTLLHETSLHEQVSKSSCPSFVWATKQDNVVPYVNATSYANALNSCGVRTELHVYPHGPHGLSNCSTEVNTPADYLSQNAKWLDDCANFFWSFVK